VLKEGRGGEADVLKLYEYFKLDERIYELFNRVRAELVSTGKDEVWNHTLRVIKNLYVIAEGVEFNFKTALIAAICHDIGYNEVVNGHEKASVLLVKRLLDGMYDHKLVGSVVHCIESHEAAEIKPQTPEAVALHDADILDYCGERGIINAFVIGKNLGLSEASSCKRIIKVIEEGFLSKGLNTKYSRELDRTEKFFLNMVKDLNKERSEYTKYGMKNL